MTPRIAVVCPIGNLDCNGYQHVYRTCIESMAAFADAVYLVQSTRDRSGVDELLTEFSNVHDISSEDTHFKLDQDGKEYFDLRRIDINCNSGLAWARGHENDIAIVVESNQYIPETALEPLRAACNLQYELEVPFGWLYRRDQLAGVTFHASLRRPWIFNLSQAVFLDQPDGARLDGKRIGHERGSYPEHDSAAVVDCPLEMDLSNLQAKLEYFRFHREYVPKRPISFDWSYWREYSLGKFRTKQRDGALLDCYGQAIAAISEQHPEFLSHELLELL